MGGRDGPRCLVEGGGVGDGELRPLRLELVEEVVDDWQQLRGGSTVVLGGSLSGTVGVMSSFCVQSVAALAKTSKPPL